MDYNRGNASNSSQEGSRFLKSFSSTNAQRGHPVTKKPKLDIDKYISLSGFTSSSKTVKEEKDVIDDLWGDDLDSTELEKVNFDESQALSQVPDTMIIKHTTGSSLQQNRISNQAPQSVSNTGNNSRSGFINHNSAGAFRNSPRVPLRRIASSGWPSASTFTNSATTSLPSATSYNLKKKPNDINFIQSDLEQLNIENETLKENLTRKTGEVNLIRDRLTTIQRELNQQKKDCSDKVNTIKQEAEENIARLSKEIKSLKGQLDIKTMEVETAERRIQHFSSVNRLHPDSPNNRFRNNLRAAFSPARSSKQTQRENQLMCGRSQMRTRAHTFTFELLQELVTPELLKPTLPEASIIESVRTITNPGLFSGQVKLKEHESSSGGHSSKAVYFTTRSNVTNMIPSVQSQLSVPCTSMEPCSLSILSSRLLDISSENAHHIISQVLRTCLQILKGQLHQLDSAVCPQKRYIEREREVLHCGYKNLMLTEDYNLLCSKELYKNERGICTRRALALVSLLVNISDFAALQILPRSLSGQTHQEKDANNIEESTNSASEALCDTQNMLPIIRDIVCQIEKQRRTVMFEGVLAGVITLIKSLLQADVSLCDKSQKMIVNILRGVIFARPGSLVIHIILRVFLVATKYPDIIDSICHNSAEKTFLENTRHSVITFSTDTCILQVLCVLLQLVETPKKHILSDVFTSWVLTLFYGSHHSPKWLFSVPSQTKCQCRPLISRLAFTLLGDACCTYPSVINKEKKMLERLLTQGILLLCTLLYHDEHFGVNVDPASVGHYELFLHSMNTFDMDVKLNRACREILESLCIQEALRQPMCTSDGQDCEQNGLLNSLYCSRSWNDPDNILQHLDTC